MSGAGNVSAPCALVRHAGQHKQPLARVLSIRLRRAEAATLNRRVGGNPMVELPDLDTDVGLCACGCGGQTAPARWSDQTRGYIKGHPKRWLKGHCNRRHGAPVSGWCVEPETGCWIWQGTTSGGYGIVRRDGRRFVAHRLIYESRVGPIPEGLQLDHLCRNRACVNPTHLEPVTCRENLRRSPLVIWNHA